MGFWSGFEGLTGHQPGAFKGFSLKDILDKDMWERTQRIRQQPGWSEASGRYEKVGEPLFDERTGDKVMTNWYKGRGRPELMNPRVSAAGVSSGALPRTGRDRPFPMLPQAGDRTKTSPYVPTPRAQARPLPAFIPGVSSNQGLNSIRQWGTQNPNVPGSMALDPTWAGGLRGAGMGAQVTPPELRREPKWIDKTTTVKESAAVDVPNTTTTVYKEKVDPAATWQPEAGAKAKPFWGLMDWYNDLRRRRHEESMANRTWRGY